MRDVKTRASFVNKDNVILMPCTYEFAPLITNINDLIVIGQLIGVYHRIN